jgi:hypothetical protein
VTLWHLIHIKVLCGLSNAKCSRSEPNRNWVRFRVPIKYFNYVLAFIFILFCFGNFSLSYWNLSPLYNKEVLWKNDVRLRLFEIQRRFQELVHVESWALPVLFVSECTKYCYPLLLTSNSVLALVNRTCSIPKQSVPARSGIRSYMSLLGTLTSDGTGNTFIKNDPWTKETTSTHVCACWSHANLQWCKNSKRQTAEGVPFCNWFSDVEVFPLLVYLSEVA